MDKILQPRVAGLGNCVPGGKVILTLEVLTGIMQFCYTVQIPRRSLSDLLSTELKSEIAKMRDF